MALALGPATREAYGETLVELGREMPELVVLDADLAKSTYTKKFAEAFPDRFFDMGIQEANMVGVAAGLALSGKVPFVSSFATFVMSKAFDQMRLAVAYSGANVKIVGSHGGISIGEDGVSQMSVEDVALAQALPGFTVLVPADAEATRQAVRAAARHPGPVFIRVGRPKAPVVYERPFAFRIGRAQLLREGRDVTLVADGLMVAAALEAADRLAGEGISARVLDMASVKPLDRQALAAAARETGAMVVAEEHQIFGGLGSSVALAVAESEPVPMEFVAIRDTFAESGKPEELLRKYGLTAEAVAEAARRALARKRLARGGSPA
ncbi:MAG: transketolase C-terminal domain-containing protein [Bacillota bacterium]|nr:transketolase C-terminal domain-containing protein [Bacillota bacterium]